MFKFEKKYILLFSKVEINHIIFHIDSDYLPDVLFLPCERQCVEKIINIMSPVDSFSCRQCISAFGSEM